MLTSLTTFLGFTPLLMFLVPALSSIRLRWMARHSGMRALGSVPEPASA